MRDPRASAFVMMRVGKDMRSSVAAKVGWAIDLLGVADQWEMTKSPLEWVRPSTGQKVMFKGGDDTPKSKGFEPPPGTYFAFTWLEELDQFGSMGEPCEDMARLKAFGHESCRHEYRGESVPVGEAPRFRVRWDDSIMGDDAAKRAAMKDGIARCAQRGCTRWSITA